MTALVEVKDLAKTYPPPMDPLAWLRGKMPGPRVALRGVSFDIREGEVVGLIGPNGAGKSTLLRILAGLLLPSDGSARVANRDVVGDRPGSRRFVGAALSEDRGLSPRLTARENLRFFAALFGMTHADATVRTAELSERFECARMLDRSVRTLSTGEKARVVLIRALLHRPRVILLDELTRALDPGAAARLRKQIVDDVAGRGAGVLFASHDLAEVETLSSRVVVLESGTCAAFGAYADVRARAEAVFAKVEP